MADMVERVLATQLDDERVRLAAVALDRRLTELEFYYPLAHLRADPLRRVLERHGYAAGPFREMIETLEFSPLRGYMKGFIDLVFEAGGRFYLVDYKSNWLGAEPGLIGARGWMKPWPASPTVLQYLIYIVRVASLSAVAAAGLRLRAAFRRGVLFVPARHESGTGIGLRHLPRPPCIDAGGWRWMS
ncbi:MAG: hypothetical protein MZV65_46150 [Chromatiales bacterium]|nr:hypothetical protein [Chromatiales bacterium]